MEQELEFFTNIAGLVNDSMVMDLHEEKLDQKRAEKLAAAKQKTKKAKEPKPSKDAKPEKEQKVKTVTLQAASSSESDAEPGPPQLQMYRSESDDGGDSDIIEGDDAPALQFSKVHIPTHADTRMHKGKNKYQKLREAAYREKIAAENPLESTWEKVKAAAAGGKVEQSVAQIKSSIKKEKQQKRKKFEKKVEKQEKEKKKEEREAKKGFKKGNKKKSSRPNFNKRK